MISSKIYCLPLQDPKKRFLLGKKGNVELLAIGLNPSTAEAAGEVVPIPT